MISLQPVHLERDGIRLEPLTQEHAAGLAEAVRDGELWKLWFTAVPEPQGVPAYIDKAQEEQTRGTMLPWAVLSGSRVVGCTRYHDVMAEIDRVEIGYTWYVASLQRTRINTVCKLMLLTHAFESLGCRVVGLRTDNFNFRSQRAIEGLGAKKDGVLRHHRRRKDGSFGDTVMYSILAGEWPEIKRHLEFRLERNRPPG
ncbi:MAG TPA: GNAT family protein [Rhizomicrobium sp.]|nr:GNAT family protein [Rhizomicrobium sp.]